MTGTFPFCRFRNGVVVASLARPPGTSAPAWFRRRCPTSQGVYRACIQLLVGGEHGGADAFAAAAGALADAFSIIKAAHLAAHPHLTHAVSVHQAKLTGRA